MPRKCAAFERAAREGRLEDPETREHIAGCESCLFDFNELQTLRGLLQQWAAAETGDSGTCPDLWKKVSARLDAPHHHDTLPLPFAGVSRLASALAQPAVAAACATGIAGVLVGLWLGQASEGLERSASYAESSLIEASETGVAATFASSFADPLEDDDSTQSP